MAKFKRTITEAVKDKLGFAKHAKGEMDLKSYVEEGPVEAVLSWVKDLGVVGQDRVFAVGFLIERGVKVTGSVITSKGTSLDWGNVVKIKKNDRRVTHDPITGRKLPGETQLPMAEFIS